MKKYINKKNFSILLMIFTFFIIITGTVSAYTASLSIPETSAAYGITRPVEVSLTDFNYITHFASDTSIGSYFRVVLSSFDLKGVWVGLDHTGDQVMDDWYPCDNSPLSNIYLCFFDDALDLSSDDDYVLNQYYYQLIISDNSSTNTGAP